MQKERQNSAAVIALAGRRVDAGGTNPPRFPLANVPVVRKRLTELLVSENAATLVCSAACGADLIALEEAERFGIQHRIVLPFQPERFREASVIDRPGDWGPSFDRLVAAADAAGDLLVLDSSARDNEAAYAAANKAILREARLLAQTTAIRRLIAVVVWEGKARVGMDMTQAFRELAAKDGFEERSIVTL